MAASLPRSWRVLCRWVVFGCSELVFRTPRNRRASGCIRPDLPGPRLILLRIFTILALQGDYCDIILHTRFLHTRFLRVANFTVCESASPIMAACRMLVASFGPRPRFLIAQSNCNHRILSSATELSSWPVASPYVGYVFFLNFTYV